MIQFIFITLTVFGLASCRNMDQQNIRDLNNQTSVGDKSLSGTDSSNGKGQEDSADDSKSKDSESDDSKDKSDDTKKSEVDPEAKPEDHTNVDLDTCFQTMPKDRDPGPFFREEKVVSNWKGRQRTSVRRVQIDPPPPGLNICKTILDECVVCTSWDTIKPEAIGDENQCDNYAEQCTNELKKECKCVRS